jgi:hypothetical protein
MTVTTMLKEAKGGIPVDDDQHANLTQWSKAARQRSRKAILHMVGKKRRARQRFCDTEDRMEHTAEEYRRALVLGADLPPMSTIEVTEETTRLEGTADQDG